MMDMKTNTLPLFKNKSIIRTYIRTLRHSIKPSEQYIAAQLITNKILTLKALHHSINIAAFISIDGEISTDLIIQTLLSINKRVYLPILPKNQSHSLLFAQYTLPTPLIKKKFNIYEPKYDPSSVINPTMLDIILIPLVAFDEYGSRLGMGGGFYDKTLHHQNLKSNCICIGLGYDFQKIPTQILPISEQDIKLSKIITPNHTYSNIHNKHNQICLIE